MVNVDTKIEKVEWTDPDRGEEGTQEVETKELVLGGRIGEG